MKRDRLRNGRAAGEGDGAAPRGCHGGVLDWIGVSGCQHVSERLRKLSVRRAQLRVLPRQGVTLADCGVNVLSAQRTKAEFVSLDVISAQRVARKDRRFGFSGGAHFEK